MTLGVLFSAAMILGLAWRWHAFVICWAAFYGVALTLFTSFFTHRGGVWTGVWGTLDYTWRPEARHADGPAFYYGMMVSVYEFLPLLACGLGARRARTVRRHAQPRDDRDRRGRARRDRRSCRRCR